MIAHMVRLTVITLVVSTVLSCVVKTSRQGTDTARQLEIKDIRIAEGTDKTIVEIEGEGLMLFTSFNISDPERLVLELSEIDLGKYRDEIKLSEGPILAITPIPRGDILISRLEFELHGEVETLVRPEGLNIVVEVTKLGGGPDRLTGSKDAQTEDLSFFRDEPSADALSKSEAGSIGTPVPGGGEGLIGMPPPLLVPPPVGVEVPDVTSLKEKPVVASKKEVGPSSDKKGVGDIAPLVIEEEKPLSSATRVDAVQFVEEDDLQVIVTLDGTLKPRIFFSDGKKSRIVIDLPGVRKSMEQSRIPGDGVFVQRVRTGKHPDKFRLVFDLILPVDFSWEQHRSELKMTLKRDPSRQNFR